MTGHELRAWRYRAGITQAEAARRLGVALGSYAGWERGAPIAHPRILALACAALEAGLAPVASPADAIAPPRRGRPRKPTA